MTSIQVTGAALWQRMERAVEKVQERLLRAAGALEKAGIPYAIAGGNAVRVWVAQVDEAAVRNTRDVDILLRREDLAKARAALEQAGFVYQESFGVTMFLVPDATPRDAIHIVFANEKVRGEHLAAAPDVDQFAQVRNFRALDLAALVRMKLVAFRDKDRMHLRDLIEVGLVDGTWVSRLPPEPGARLQQLLDTPDG